MQTAAIKFEKFQHSQDEECQERILAAREKLGKRLVILGHHYQHESVYRHADLTGDSLKLSRHAAAADAEIIVFLGVHFMAEVADILSRPDQIVILPDLAAGCSMADMANLAKVERSRRELSKVLDFDEVITPLTYINSAADLKAFCGEHGGIVCTSTNAPKMLEWAFARREKVLFFPDQNLGRWSGHKMGIPLEQMPVWDPRKPLGGVSDQVLRDSRVILWHGYCSVHKRFTVEQIEQARAQFPGVRVIVHPECPMEVVDAADEAGSTDYIKKAVEAAPAGTVFAIGTEINMVQRLAKEHPDKTLFCLDPVVCPCSTMYRIHPAYLAWVLEAFERGEVLNRITVPEEIAAPARVALERMLAANPAPQTR